MSKTLIRQIDKHIELYKDEQNGLAWNEMEQLESNIAVILILMEQDLFLE